MDIYVSPSIAPSSLPLFPPTHHKNFVKTWKFLPKKEVKSWKLWKCEKPLWKKSKKQNKDDYKKNTEPSFNCSPFANSFATYPNWPSILSGFLNFTQQLKEEGMRRPVAKSGSFGANDAQREETEVRFGFSFLSDFLFFVIEK